MAKYNNEVLAEMCSKVDLLDYVSNNHEVKMIAGNHYIKCPVHKGDNDPSMIINPETNKYYCFGCNARGSSLDWLVKVEHLSWNDAINKLIKLSGMEDVHLKQCDALAFYKQIKRIVEKKSSVEKINRTILPDDYLEQFSTEIPQEWIDEGISEQVIKKYGIRTDKKSNRIIYPVYDSHIRLIGVKGRTKFKNASELGIQKYMNYQKIGTVDYFMGWKENKNTILFDKKVIIFEGIKSVMKLDDFGDCHGLAAETSCLNDEQIKLLIQWGLKDITIAFDSDICLDKIKKCTEKLRMFTNVYVVLDRKHLLGEKCSPVDAGKEVWEELFRERIKI